MLWDELDEDDQGVRQATYCEEGPLEHDALVVTSSGEGKDTVGVILASEIKENGGCFKNAKVWFWFAGSVDEDGDATVGVERDEPWFLLTVGGNVDLLDAVCARSGGS